MGARGIVIELKSSGKTFVLPRDFITTTLAGSLLADALELDPDATSISFDNPVVTPEALMLLVDLADSPAREPDKPHPELAAAFAYLNLPKLQVYTDVFYKDIVAHRVDTKLLLEEAQRHARSPYLLVYSESLEESIREQRSRIDELMKKFIDYDEWYLCAYLMERGFKVHHRYFSYAIEADADRVVGLFLTDQELTVETEDLEEAIKSDNHEIVQLLLQDGRCGPELCCRDLLRGLYRRHQITIAKLLLKDGRVTVEDLTPKLEDDGERERWSKWITRVMKPSLEST